MVLDPISALSAVSTILNIVDKVAGQFQRFRKKEPEPAVEKPHKVIAQKGDGKSLSGAKGKLSSKLPLTIYKSSMKIAAL